MKTINIEQVIATHRHEWKKWPDTDDKDYSSVFALRETWKFERDDTEVIVTNRFYPVYSAYTRSGDLALVQRFPVIDNLKPPSERVLEQQRVDLAEISKECRSIWWEHTHQCFPQVVSQLPTWFPGVRVIGFSDDCPGSSDVKTFPVAAYFNALLYAMYIWNADDGALTAEEYRKRGLEYTRFCPSTTTIGIMEGLAENNFSIEEKQRRIRRGEALPHLGFVGFAGGGDRGRMMRELCLVHARQKRSGLQLRMHGVNMPDGILEPRDPPHPMGLGYPSVPLYMNALSSVNVPISSLFNSRFADCFYAGMVQIATDKWGELAKHGFVDGEHYVKFDGTCDDLIAKLEGLIADPLRAAAIVGRGYTKALMFWAENSWTKAVGDIYFDHLGVLT